MGLKDIARDYCAIMVIPVYGYPKAQSKNVMADVIGVEVTTY